METTKNSRWIDEFIIELRLRNVPGEQIGDAVASVRELLGDTRQSAEEAFGSARSYAGSLQFPASPRRRRSVGEVWLSAISVLALLWFAQALTPWFEGGRLTFSPAQILLLTVPVVLVLALPLYFAALVRHLWLAIPLVVIAAGASAMATLLAPGSAGEAWFSAPPGPWLAVCGATILAIAVIQTVRVARRDSDEVVTPSAAATVAERTPTARRRRPVALITVNWLMPAFAALLVAMTWILTR